jgi:hypothetical protein
MMDLLFYTNVEKILEGYILSIVTQDAISS